MSAFKKIKFSGFVILAAISFICIGLCMYSLCKYYLLKQKYEQITKYTPPVINYVKFQTLDGKDINKQDNRYFLDSKSKIIISISGECQVVELYYTEDRTQTWKHQKLIYPVAVSHGENHAVEYTWDVPDAGGSFWIVAYNLPVGIKSDSLIFERK